MNWNDAVELVAKMIVVALLTTAVVLVLGIEFPDSFTERQQSCLDGGYSDLLVIRGIDWCVDIDDGELRGVQRETLTK